MLSTIKKRFYMTIYTIYWTQSILTLLFVQFLTVHHSLFCWLLLYPRWRPSIFFPSPSP